jgi:hypothetical protein
MMKTWQHEQDAQEERARMVECDFLRGQHTATPALLELNE